MNSKSIIPFLALIFLINISFASALVVDADYITIYPGEQGSVNIDVENNQNFDIEEVSVQIILVHVLPDGTSISLPFTVIGSSEKELDDLDEDDDDSTSFTLKASTDIEPGDYNIPYVITYVDADDNDDDYEKAGSFGIRVSAKTELDFAAEAKGASIETPILEQEGKLSLEIINKGLGEIKSMSVEIFPQGFEILSKSKIFIGGVDADDTDFATFNVIYKTTTPVLKAKITYKDFDNNDQIENINLPFKVYTSEEALEKGLIQKSNTGLYIGIIILLIIIWVIYRKIKRRKKKKNRGSE
ncbi:MAG: hypothetical protein KKF48_03195 [Nanoarchaeota archaeon]|nr:hypothetical protein [Nanoarchaeota archaeon]MBU1028029.1 hypothetical protein [Nanoarchaeota archaeon]